MGKKRHLTQKPFMRYFFPTVLKWAIGISPLIIEMDAQSHL